LARQPRTPPRGEFVEHDSDPTFERDIDSYRALDRAARRLRRGPPDARDAAKKAALEALSDLCERWGWPLWVPLPATRAEKVRATWRPDKAAIRPPVHVRRWTLRDDPRWPAVRDALGTIAPHRKGTALDRLADTIARQAAPIRLAQASAWYDAFEYQSVSQKERKRLGRRPTRRELYDDLEAKWIQRARRDTRRRAPRDGIPVGHPRETFREFLKRMAQDSAMHRQIMRAVVHRTRSDVTRPRGRPREWCPEALPQVLKLATMLESGRYRLSAPAIAQVFVAAGVYPGPYQKRKYVIAATSTRSKVEAAVQRLLARRRAP
jgi:hypothetical protein